MRDIPVMPRCPSFWAISALAIAMAGPVQAKEVPAPTGPEAPYQTAGRLLGFSVVGREDKMDDHDPHATNETLRALLAMSNAVIPASSSCYGHYGQRKTTVKDLLADQLAYMYPGGQYVIQGNCHAGQCALVINRRGREEDVSSATIVFNTVRGKARISSLECVMTP
jgi:hypothetical protein